MIRVGQSLGQMYGYRLKGIYTMDDFTYDANQQKYILKEGIPYDKSRYPKPGYWKFEDIDKNGESPIKIVKLSGMPIPNSMVA